MQRQSEEKQKSWWNLFSSKKEPQSPETIAEVKKLKKLAKSGNINAQFDLGQRYYEGNGVKKNIDKSASFYKKAARKGHDKAQYILGLYYYTGLGVTQDFVKTSWWLENATRQGNEDAKYSHDALWRNGGLDEDYAEALRHCQLTINLKHIDAEFLLATWYDSGLEYGDGEGYKIFKNLKKAAALFQKTAERGHVFAQYKLGIYYKEGKGELKKDIDLAVFWFRKAGLQGHSESIAELKVLQKDFIVTKPGTPSINIKTLAAQAALEIKFSGTASAAKHSLTAKDFEAFRNGDIAALRYLINQKDKLTHPCDKNGNRLLHLAVINNQPQLVLELLEVGADKSKMNVSGLTPVALAELAKNQVIMALFSNNIETISAGIEALTKIMEEAPKLSRWYIVRAHLYTQILETSVLLTQQESSCIKAISDYQRVIFLEPANIKVPQAFIKFSKQLEEIKLKKAAQQDQSDGMVLLKAKTRRNSLLKQKEELKKYDEQLHEQQEIKSAEKSKAHIKELETTRKHWGLKSLAEIQKIYKDWITKEPGEVANYCELGGFYQFCANKAVDDQRVALLQNALTTFQKGLKADPSDDICVQGCKDVRDQFNILNTPPVKTTPASKAAAIPTSAAIKLTPKIQTESDKIKIAKFTEAYSSKLKP